MTNPTYFTGTIDKSTRVITAAPGKEHQVIYRTKGRTPQLTALYESYKMTDNKAQWFLDNAAIIKKYDINVSAIKGVKA